MKPLRPAGTLGFPCLLSSMHMASSICSSYSLIFLEDTTKIGHLLLNVHKQG
jgi:hypothetical protein